MTKRKTADPTAHRNLAREVEQKQVRDLQAALNAYWEVINLKWMPMIQPLVSLAVRYGVATTPDQLILLESVYKDQLLSAVEHRAKFARHHVRAALQALAEGFGWHVVDEAPPPQKAKRTRRQEPR